jgi:hypothetical protein
MLNERERQVLADLERALRADDPALVQKFEDADFSPSWRDRHRRALTVLIGVVVLLGVAAALVQAPRQALALAAVALALALVRHRPRPPRPPRTSRHP